MPLMNKKVYDTEQKMAALRDGQVGRGTAVYCMACRPNQGLRPLFLAVCTANKPQLFMFGMLTLAPCAQYDPMEAKNEARNQRLQGPKFKKSE